MFDIKALFLRAMLALAIVSAAPAALANPIYRVTIDTSAWAGTSGWLDFGFNGPGAPEAEVRIGRLAGDFLADQRLAGDVGGNVADGLWLGNGTGYNFLDQAVRFGNTISFDVLIDELASGGGILFSMALFNQDGTAYLGAETDLLTIDRVPGAPDVIAVLGEIVSIHADPNAVPEPADWLLVASGLLLIGLSRRAARR